MESRIQFQGKLHFFEHYSVEKLEEYFRNALYFSLDILTQQNPHLVRFRYYTKELTSLLEIILHGGFILTKDASFGEYFYSYNRHKMGKLKKILSILMIALIPYFQTKLKELDRKAQQCNQRKTSITIQIIDTIIGLWNFSLKSTYLLGDEKYSYYSPYYQIFKINLQRIKQQDSKLEQFWKYGTFILFLGLQLLDYYYSDKPGPQQQHKVVSPPDIVEKQRLCPLCREPIQNPGLLKTAGLVYCYKCIFDWVTEKNICPATKQSVDTSQITKIYQ